MKSKKIKKNKKDIKNLVNEKNPIKDSEKLLDDFSNIIKSILKKSK